VDKSLALQLTGMGVETDRLSSLVNAASRSCHTKLENVFEKISATATNMQRDLNRSMVPIIKQHMQAGYTAVVILQGGKNCFDRMSSSMVNHTQRMMSTMFRKCMTELLQGIELMVQNLSAMISDSADIIVKTLETIFSVIWEDQSKKAMHIDCNAQIRECRNRVLPDIHAITGRMGKAMDLMGIEGPPVDSEVAGVNNGDVQNQSKLSVAQQQNMVIDLCEDD